MIIGYLNDKEIRFHEGVDLCKVEIGKNFQGCTVLSVKELISGSDGFVTSQGDTCRFFDITVQNADMIVKHWYYLHRIYRYYR